MHLHEAIETRKSVRSFTKKKVSKKIIREILRLGSLAPSGTNTQPWKAHVITGKKLKKITDAVKKDFIKNNKNLSLERLNYMHKYREPYLSRRRKVGWDLYQILDIKKGDYKKTLDFHSLNYEFFGAPVGIIFSIEKDLGWMSWLDYGMFLQNICLAARSFDLHSCPQAAWGLIHKKINKLLKIEKNFTVHVGLALGYINEKSKVNQLLTERNKVDNFTTFLS